MAVSVPSGNEDYNIVQYSSDNGLPQNTINDLLMDKNHFLWIATHNGLVRWDGQRFRVYNTSNTPVLKSNRFPLLSETLQGRILILSNFDDSSINRVTDDYRIILDSEYTRLQRKLISYHSNGIFDVERLVEAVRVRSHAQGEQRLLERLFQAAAFWIFDEYEAVLAEGPAYYYVNNRSGIVRRLEGGRARKDRTKGFAIGDVFCIAHNDGHVDFYKQGLRVDARSERMINLLLKGYASLNSSEFFIYSKEGRTFLRKHNDFYSATSDWWSCRNNRPLLFQGG